MFRLLITLFAHDFPTLTISNPQVLAWEAANGISGSEGTYEYFVDRVATITRDQQRTPVQWVEVFEHFGRYVNMQRDVA